MINIFLGGVFCGVIMAAAVTFAFAIPGTNELWRVEITKHGGGNWSMDKEGKFHWAWSVPEVDRHGRPLKPVALPKSRPASDSSHEQL